MTYLIKRRKGQTFFAGFGPAPAFGAIWTDDASEAKTGDHAWAKGQALALRRTDSNVQQKPVKA